MFEIVNLVGQGLVPYSDGVALQETLHAGVSSGTRPDTLVLLEHESVYTGGKMSEMTDIADPGVSLVETNRGGKITWHGPGQLVGYPIYRLPKPIDVVGYVRTLEHMLIDVIAQWGVVGQRVEKRTGVWVGPPGVEQKVAAIGIRVAERTTMHGFALNVSNSLEPFKAIFACGIRDAGATTVELEAGKAVSVSDAASAVEKTVGRFFP
jgi:lipoyl(octanoyl) transferase